MRWLFRHFWLPFYRIWALRYIRRERVFRYGHLKMTVPSGVFHPGVFFSTPVFLRFLESIDFQDKRALDVGTGSGALALFAAQKGATVTAFDINPVAVETARRNAVVNGLDLQVLESDLFDALLPQVFDYVLINPPFYPGTAKSDAEHAFFAGAELAYFKKLFRQLPDFRHAESQTWMILSEDCDLGKIEELAGLSGFRLNPVFEEKKWGERLSIFEIIRNPH